MAVWVWRCENGRAAQAIPKAAAEPWALAMLAGIAGMPRSKLVARFQAITGTSPINYLTRWRMLLGCQHLA